MAQEIDVVVIGAGQSGLALGFYLQRLGRRAGTEPVSFVLLDDSDVPGGAWTDGWESLTLFSPAVYSSLAGWPMPAWSGEGNPSAAHVAAYLRDYEERYDLPVRRPVRVTEVRDEARGDGRLDVVTGPGTDDGWRARAVASATGSWTRPFWPHLPGADDFTGTQVHTAGYRSPDGLPGERVLVVGGGNSGAQVAADLLLAGRRVVWATRGAPQYLPDEVDGRALFEVASGAVRDRADGRANAGVGGLGDIVAVPSVRRARDELGLRAVDVPLRLTATGAVWRDGSTEELDAVVWCTGFRPALRHLQPLGLDHERGHPRTTHPPDHGFAAVATSDERVLLLGYGDWCAPASATLIGVNRPARDTADVIAALLSADGG